MEPELDGADMEKMQIYDSLRQRIKGLEAEVLSLKLPTNLDCMDATALVRLARCHMLLARYAGLKAQAMRRREKGDINKALELEARCDALYRQLPRHARW